MEPEVLVVTVKEAGRLLKISRGATYAAIRDGVLPSLRIGRSIRLPVAALAKLLAGGTPQGRTATGGPGERA